HHTRPSRRAPPTGPTERSATHPPPPPPPPGPGPPPAVPAGVTAGVRAAAPGAGERADQPDHYPGDEHDDQDRTEPFHDPPPRLGLRLVGRVRVADDRSAASRPGLARRLDLLLVRLERVP